MAQCVVDLLEAVEVDEQRGEPGGRGGEVFGEQGAVGNPVR